MTWDLSQLGADAVARCAVRLRDETIAATSMDDAAQRICRVFITGLAGPSGSEACVMVRCYKTHAFGALPPSLQRFAKRALGTVAISPAHPEMKCLTLLATAGTEAEWNDRRQSRGHQAIPLPSPHVVERAPMIAKLIQELGMDVGRLVRGQAPGEQLFNRFGIFHVPDAVGSPHIPAQDFVERFNVRSVLGIGGVLADGDLFAVIIFSREPITVAAAERLRTLAPVLDECLGRFAAEETFAPESGDSA